MTQPAQTLDLDTVNQAVWSSPALLEEFEKLGSLEQGSCWTDPGEQAALGHAASAVRGLPILDIGVGGGRTTALLRLLSDDYVAIDYTPRMVAACRHNHPDVDVRVGDARDLSTFDDETFGLVVFSYNGLDAMDHEARQQALSEMARVLRPGGLLLYSTHNKSGPCYRATPLRRAGSPTAHTWSRSFRWAMRLQAALESPVRLPRALRNTRRLARSKIDGGQWGVSPLEAHDFSLLIHYTTLRGASSELASVGLALDAAFGAEHGSALELQDDPTGVRYFQLVARKSA